METALSREREQHMNEIKKLNALLNEKVLNYHGFYFSSYLEFYNSCLGLIFLCSSSVSDAEPVYYVVHAFDKDYDL